MRTPTSEDEELWAARIRAHFEPHLRDTAEQAAQVLVTYVGVGIKQLRPETRLSDLSIWAKESGSALDSLDWMELVMGLEEELEISIPDSDAALIGGDTTFRELIVCLAKYRRA